MNILLHALSGERLTATRGSESEDFAALASPWRDLMEASDANEPMLSPEWLQTWWDVFGGQDGRRLRLIRFDESDLVVRPSSIDETARPQAAERQGVPSTHGLEGGRLVGLAPLLLRRRWYWPGLPFRRLEALASGEDEADAVCSDYLNILCERGRAPAVADALVRGLAACRWGAWDELVLPMMDGEGLFPALLEEACRRTGLAFHLRTTGEAPYIPLPATWEDYLKQLSGADRYYVNRSLRDFERWADGEARFALAATAAELEEGKRILHALHQERWEGKGAGAFHSPRFQAFHNRLMRLFLDKGALELLWLTVRGEPAAVIHNLVWKEKTYFYQCGRSLGVPEKVRPGVVLHVHAIQRAIEAGRREYDFLSGACRYKKQLALASRPLVQVRIARPSFRENVRRTAERCQDVVRGLRGRFRCSGTANSAEG